MRANFGASVSGAGSAGGGQVLPAGSPIGDIRARNPELVSAINATLAERGIGNDGEWQGAILRFNEAALLEAARKKTMNT